MSVAPDVDAPSIEQLLLNVRAVARHISNLRGSSTMFVPRPPSALLEQGCNVQGLSRGVGSCAAGGRDRPMFARAVWVDVEPDKLDELSTLVGQAAATLSQQAGYQGTLVLADRDTGAGSVVTYWETLADLQRSERGAAQARVDVQARIPGLRIRDIERLEFVIQERTAPPQVNTFIRVADAHVPPDRIDDVVRFVREQALPALKAQQGFRAALTAVNRTSGRAISTSVWDSAANLEASESAIAPLRSQATTMGGAQPANVSRYEVLLANIKVAAAV